MNISTGIYEQIINQLFRVKLDAIDTSQFYVGTKKIGKEEAVVLLGRYLQRLLETAFASIPDDQSSEKCVEFVNSVIKALGREFCLDEHVKWGLTPFYKR